MEWFNYYGLIIMSLIMVPNIIYAHKVNIQNNNKTLEIFEQIGRYGCMFLMIFNIPHMYYNFYFPNALTVYLSLNGILLSIYLYIWFFCFKKYSYFIAYLLSVIPTLIFFISGILLLYIPLIILSIIFGICHIKISVDKLK